MTYVDCFGSNTTDHASFDEDFVALIRRNIERIYIAIEQRALASSSASWPSVVMWTFMITSIVALIVAAAVLIFKSPEYQATQSNPAASVDVVIEQRQRNKKRKLSQLEFAGIDRPLSNNELGPVATSSHVNIIPDRDSCVDDPTTLQLQLTKRRYEHSFDGIASRWEAKGLERQTSLKLAAIFEMVLFFFDQSKLCLSMTSFQFLGQMNRFSSSIEHQLETNHRELRDQLETHHMERMNAPELEKLQKYRHRIMFSLLNPTTMTRSLCIAFAVRFYPYVAMLLYEPITALGAVIPILCPPCDTLIDEHQASMALTALKYFGPWISTLFCIIKAICLLLCHHYICKTLVYVLLAGYFIPWEDVLMMSCVVFMVNSLLTFVMLWQCKCAEETAQTDKREATNKIVDYYAQTIFIYQAMAYVTSMAFGLFMSIEK